MGSAGAVVGRRLQLFKASSQTIGILDVSTASDFDQSDIIFLPTLDAAQTLDKVVLKVAYLRLLQLVEVWRDVEEDPIDSTGQSDSTAEQYEQHEVRIRGGEVHHLWDKHIQNCRVTQALVGDLSAAQHSDLVSPSLEAERPRDGRGQHTPSSFRSLSEMLYCSAAQQQHSSHSFKKCGCEKQYMLIFELKVFYMHHGRSQ